jgi:TolB-like protein/DNA-binding winged helix-turn-helix (wHTH) protein
MSQEIHRFEDFELDQSAHELRRNGCVVHLERVPFELLCLLVERGGQLVTRGEILDRVWGKGVFIHAESSINTAMRKIRRALNDDSNPPKFVLTIPAKGYRFMVSVHTLNGTLKTNSESVQVSSTGPFKGSTQGRVHKWWQTSALSASGLAIIAAAILLALHPSLHPSKRFAVVASVDRPARKLSNRSSVAVLPFANLSGDGEQDYLIDGITDDLINALSRLTNIFVIARTSSFTYKDRAPKAPEIGRELRVKYLLEGSVQRAGNSVRVNTQLVNAATGGILWAERYDISLRDIFVLQDEIVQKIVTALSHQVDGLGEGRDPRALALTAPGLPGCYDPADFGAVADDGIDDSVPSQQALDAASVAGGRVCFGHGRASVLWSRTVASVPRAGRRLQPLCGALDPRRACRDRGSRARDGA